MKKLLTGTIILLFLMAARHAIGIPGCVLYWTGSDSFFGANGVVQVVHPDGSGYVVNSGNYAGSTNHYGLQAGSHVYVYRPAGMPCRFVEGWGAVTWIPCGNVSQGSSHPMSLAYNVSWVLYTAYEDCECPNAGSGGLGIDYEVSCQ